MKLLALCVICGFIATNSFTQAETEKDAHDESSDYSDLFGDAIRRIKALLGNAIGGNDSNDSGSGSDSVEDKINSGILQALKNNDDDDDSSEEVENMLDTIDSLFDGTIEKLQTLGEEAINEFKESLLDLIEDFIESEVIDEIEENNTPQLESEVQQLNTQNIEDNTNGNEKDNKIEQAAGVEEHTDGNSVIVEQQENTKTEDAMQVDKQQENNENSSNEKQTETSENETQKEADLIKENEIN